MKPNLMLARGDGTVVRIIIGSVLGAVAVLLVIVGVFVAVLVYCCHKRSMNIVEKKDRQVYYSIRYYVINRLYCIKASVKYKSFK